MSWGFNSRQGWTRRCPAPCPVVVIDEDDDGEDASDSEVYIIDHAAEGEAAPAPAPGHQGRKGNGSSSNVINIDDDDEDVEEGAGGDKAGPSTSRASGSPASTTPGRGSPRNRYGLDCTSDSSESDSSGRWDDGSSDCEILDDTTGTACWETAASRKKVPHGVHECKDDRGTTFPSRAGSEAQLDKDSDGLFGAEFHQDKSFFWHFAAECKDDSQNSAGGTKEGPSGDTCKEGAQNDTGGSKNGHSPSSAPNATEYSTGKEGVAPEKVSERVQSPRLDETFVYNSIPANSVFPGSSSVDQEDGSPPISVCTPEKIDEKIAEGVYSQKGDSPPEVHNNTDTYSAKDGGSVRDQQNELPPFSSRCDSSRQFGEDCLQVQANSCACAAAPGSCSLPRKDLIDDPEELGQFDSVQGASVIGEREKHKESVEFKRAAAEEWASRQRQLQIQAEEAKKLRKRKKAEAQRLLDMEKRQKQRLQEVRESQRKNEEAIQLKEQYRGIVRKELEEMERRYWDMTSILRALGIPVEGGEVKAYKQALLKFHPDRVSRNDIYQQVKAEETFKFISRLKEKLPRLS